MQDHTSPPSLENAIALQKYGVGQPVRRKEDDTLVRGKGKYTDDFSLPRAGLCLDHTFQPRPRHHSRHRHHGRQIDAGRLASGLEPTSLPPIMARSSARCR